MKTLFLGLILLLLSLSAYSQSNYYVYHDMEKDTVALDEAVVYGSLRAKNSTPFSFTNVTKTTLEMLPGAEASYALSTTPSITFYSDNGSNLGYVYYRLRGIDQTRLNVTLNGVPLNEPEDQGSYFNNFPGFLSVIRDIQIIRGAGLSKVGTSTFGGSLNFETKDGSSSDLVEFSTSLGSNLTKMVNASVNANHFFIGASRFSTEGYKYNSDNNSWSTNYGVDFNSSDWKVKLFGMLGKQKNGMAWVGETLNQIYIDPKSNTNKLGERDDFLNIHNQLTLESTYSKKNKSTFSLFHQYQDGWYDTDISLFDPSLKEAELMSRIKLKFNWAGVLFNHQILLNKLTLNTGANYNLQIRNHEGLDNFQSTGFVSSYTNTGTKQDFAQYIKGELKLFKFTFYGDIKSRYVNYKYDSPTDNLTLYNKVNLNYSAGISYKISSSVFHYGYGKSTREPRRSDLFGGFDNYSGYINNLNDETVISQDLGYKYISDDLQFSANFYKMKFDNEFMPTGEYGENGITLYKNVKDSYRKGIEFSGTYKNKKYTGSFNLTLSENKFKSKDHKAAGPTEFMIYYNSILSPSTVGNINLTRNIGNHCYVGLSYRYNSKTYIDLNNEYMLPSYYVIDGFVGAKNKTFELKLNLNNLTNSLILTNGMLGFDGNPRYFVMSKLSSLLTLKIKI